MNIVSTEQVPPPGKGSLYLRPLLLGSGPVLGLAPAPEYTFLIYASPVRNYFKVSQPLFLFLSFFPLCFGHCSWLAYNYFNSMPTFEWFTGTAGGFCTAQLVCGGEF